MVLKALAIFASVALITAGEAAEVVPASRASLAERSEETDGSRASPAWRRQAKQSGGIRGRLDIRKLEKPVERRPEVSAPGAAGPRDVPDLRRGVVYLDTAPRSAFDERDPGRAVMDQRNERFVPHVLAVMVGTIVDFPNSDLIYHNVFSLSRAKRFDLGRYAAGKSKGVRMDRPGVVRVFCDIHSHMNAFVLVFNHPFFDVTDVDWHFELPSVPSGTYTIVGWYEGEARVSHPVVVPASGWAEVDLVVQ